MKKLKTMPICLACNKYKAYFKTTYTFGKFGKKLPVTIPTRLVATVTALTAIEKKNTLVCDACEFAKWEK